MMASNEEPRVGTCVFARQDSSSTSLSLGFDPYQVGLKLHFVEPLEDRYKCVTCSFVLCNPFQTGCGHRFCENCIKEFIDIKSIAICPIDHERIIPSGVFKDACCKREVWNLMLYCKYAPDCNVKVSLGRLGDHLKKCLFESVPCSNGCGLVFRRKDLTDHVTTACEYREEVCRYCKVTLLFKHFKEHEEDSCPKYPVQCLYNCGESVSRNEVAAHLLECPEAEVECSYKKYGCHIREKRRKMQEHEDSSINSHLLLVIASSSKLEGQIMDLKNNLFERNQFVSQLEDKIKKLEKDLAQLSQHISKTDNTLTSTQKNLAGHMDKILTTEERLRQFSRKLDQAEINDASGLKEIVSVLKKKVENVENNIQSLGVLESRLKQHESLLRAHKDLLEKTNERFRVLETTSYSGKLIWKICDYRKTKQDAVEGRVYSLYSLPFYTSRCGYRLCARVYLNGDGLGKGTHLSLFSVVMKGEYDSLLPWPFKQKVTLMLLDQGPKKNHILEVFKADANSSSFKRPEAEMNIASGCPRFVSHALLESGKTATYIKDDTLFIKVIVDLTDLDDL
ncbi:TNF receptor-associated factor 5 [Callorhinchus milii]|uniref:TNF receptor-associated factor n=2 Tax=Callorhinchus milii TaxID=7868 RepID=A0A4W3H8B4_CALMI|nr:TNF receptor-associated factor 5 [Callorhinchus milii]XP_007890672.1 TNF receptor-associated factor 5 [Callorhinchus milii]XP_007890673.1 TNF receptor-associated factor 5 [Callorhinchus milii]XP_007890674.1 TNF receptor-associated factor 5 [Callorhinchus milii]|eukprot:gi/632950358/ref/XP_007890671.1/ PREDICTED: TNF receptor-associated factor 5 [Callorhinchus milii]